MTRAPARFEWIGGALPLDFVNTVTWTRAGEVNERLETYGDLVAWAVEAGLVSRREGARLRRRGDARPRAAAEALAWARRLRGALHSAFIATAEGRRVPGGAMQDINTALAGAVSRLCLVHGQDAWALTVGEDHASLTGMLGAVVWQAAQLLVSDERGRLKHCASRDCGWVFLDSSRNGSRRWCDMKVCGNNEKARRFYRRHREEAGRDL